MPEDGCSDKNFDRFALTLRGSRRAYGLSSKLRNGADVALLMPERNRMVTHLTQLVLLDINVQKPNISGQVF